MSEEANEIYIERDRERWREMERDEAIAVSQELMVE